MQESRPTIRSDEDHREFHQHLHGHHFKGILVMLGFTIAQFFFMGYIVDAGELTIKALLGCTNVIRLNHGQSNELVLNETLDTAAENKLRDMAQYKYWAHQNPVTGKQPWDFIDAAGYPYETAGENLAYGFNNSQEICDAWEKSPKHLANIKDPTFEEVGFAVDKANLHKNEKGILVVQMFGSRNGFVPSQTQESARASTQQCGTGDKACISQNVRPQVKGVSTFNPSAPYSQIPVAQSSENPESNNIILYVTGFSLFFLVIRLLYSRSKKDKKTRATRRKSP